MLRKFIGRFSCALCATICMLSLSVPSFATEVPQVMDGIPFAAGITLNF